MYDAPMEGLNQRITIDACRNHHHLLRDIIAQLPADVPADAASVSASLRRLRNVLVVHLRLEDNALYPALLNSKNAVLRGKAQRYRTHMGGIAQGFAVFFDRWSRADAIEADPARFLDDWNEFKSALLQRMDAEDHDLYVAAESATPD